jgi:hypothetical protein
MPGYLQEVVKDADILIFCAPHQFIHGICKQIRGKINPDAIAISLTKVPLPQLHVPRCPSQDPVFLLFIASGPVDSGPKHRKVVRIPSTQHRMCFRHFAWVVDGLLGSQDGVLLLNPLPCVAPVGTALLAARVPHASRMWPQSSIGTLGYLHNLLKVACCRVTQLAQECPKIVVPRT